MNAQTHKHRSIYYTAAIVGLVVVLAAPLLIMEHLKTVRLTALWRQFTVTIQEGDMEKAKELIACPEEWYPSILHYLRFNDERVTYHGHDVTDVLSQSKSSYRRTITANLGSKDHEKDKVVFDVGYAIVSAGKIIFIKIP